MPGLYIFEALMAGGKNRFNRISSKEWLPFQKSWFKYDSEKDWLKSNFRFFTTREETDYEIYYRGPARQIARNEAGKLGFKLTRKGTDSSKHVQLAFFDLRPEIAEMEPSLWPDYRNEFLKELRKVAKKMIHRRFVVIAIPNIQTNQNYYPIAWDLALHVGSFLTLKDEKIACLESETPDLTGAFSPDKGHFYCLHFRNDENSGFHKTRTRQLFQRIAQEKLMGLSKTQLPSWFILKPQRRKKNEILHPAKFPEDLADLFVQKFTKPGDNVFDPMSGTGSTQVSALRNGRNAYGTELSSFFAEIARERALAFLFEQSRDFPKKFVPEVDIIEGDARKATSYGFPEQDLIFTSPPYWDMLNMKGAENQAKRIKKGLRTNYSDDEDDLGNLSDYDEFVESLAKIYIDMLPLLKPGGVMVIVVKNIKKKGKNYPFAWDLAAKLQDELILLPEVFWCQDDISIAPYGYGNTFVSNTFHQYCLIFQKPR